jgi:DNA-binding transcriptional MerR regulator
MAKKKSLSRAEKIKKDIPPELTDLIGQLAEHALPGMKMMYTRVNEGGFIATYGMSAPIEMKKEEYIMSDAKLPITSVVIDLHKYKKGEKIPNTSNKGVAFTKTTLSDFYEHVKAHYHISDRMIRRYISRGLIPPPERYGKNAYYDEAGSNVFSHLNVIDTLKKRYNLSLDDIEVIVNNYRDQIIELDFLLSDIEIEYNKPRQTSPLYVWIRKSFLERIQSKTVDLNKLDIKTIEKEAKKKQS